MSKEKKNEITIRSSAAEYLTFIAATGDDEKSVEMRYEDENIWLTQKMMAELYDVGVNTINYHLKTIFDDAELSAEATIRKFRIVQTEGSRQVERHIDHYSLQAIIAVGFKVNNERAVMFRKWANQIVKDYTIQGWTMDVERLKKGHMFTDEYFDEQLQRIREIRLSERKFYQKITDIYATSMDLAEVQAMRKIPMTMADWETRLNAFIKAADREILSDAGKVTAEIARQHTETEFEKYRIVQDRLFESDFDRFAALEQMLGDNY